LEGLYLRSNPETSPIDLQCPDLSLYEVSRHLEVSFIQAKLLGTDRVQEGATSLEDSSFGGESLGIFP